MALTRDQKLMLLNSVRTAVADHPELQTEIFEACVRGTLDRYEKVNNMRVEAETALLQIFDLVPESKRVKHQYAITRAKKVLVCSGAYGGTEFTKQLAAEIGMAENGHV